MIAIQDPDSTVVSTRAHTVRGNTATPSLVQQQTGAPTELHQCYSKSSGRPTLQVATTQKHTNPGNLPAPFDITPFLISGTLYSTCLHASHIGKAVNGLNPNFHPQRSLVTTAAYHSPIRVPRGFLLYHLRKKTEVAIELPNHVTAWPAPGSSRTAVILSWIRKDEQTTTPPEGRPLNRTVSR